MTEINEPAGRQPDFKGDGVAVWVNKTTAGKQYLSINIFQGSVKVAAWKNEPEQPQATPEQPKQTTADHVVVTQETPGNL